MHNNFDEDILNDKSCKKMLAMDFQLSFYFFLHTVFLINFPVYIPYVDFAQGSETDSLNLAL